MITIIGLGEKKGEITMLAKSALDAAAYVVVRTSKQAFSIKYHYSLDDIYLSAADYEDFNRRAVNTLLELEKQYGDIVYAVSGDGFCDSSVELLCSLGAKVTHIAGAAATRPVATSLIYLSAYDLNLRTQLDNLPLFIHSIDSHVIASEVKLYLLKFYSYNTAVLFYSEKGEELITLEDLDRQSKYGPFCKAFLEVYTGFNAENPALNADNCFINNGKSACVNSNKNDSKNADNGLLFSVEKGANKDSEFDKTVYTFGDLIRIVERLTAANGCPWDIAQTHQSIRTNMIEEAYEAVAAIDSGDVDNLIEELGDVMLQSVFNADIARRHGEFELSDVITALCRKLYTRHTHIFGGKAASSPADALQNWEDAKAIEKSVIRPANGAYSSEPSKKTLKQDKNEFVKNLKAEIANKYKALPAALRAQKTVQKLVKSGIITLDNTQRDTVKDIASGGNPDFGKLLFDAVAFCQLNGVDAEVELNAYLNKLLNS